MNEKRRGRPFPKRRDTARGAVRAGGTRGAAGPPAPERAAPKPHPRAPRPTAGELREGLYPLPPVGSFLVACREGFERDVADEVAMAAPRSTVRILLPGLVSIEGTLPRRDGRVDLTFARQGFPLAEAVHGRSELAGRIAAAVATHAPARAPTTFHLFVPDSDESNLLSQPAARLAEEVERALSARLQERLHHGDPRRAGGQLAQACLVQPELALVGAVASAAALSPFPGGRARMKVPARAPSRAAMKLAEALDWLGVGPEAGDSCVDLGAAPGGWTFLLVERRARVLAVDPGRLRADLARHPLVRAVRRSAFEFEPDEPVDWLMCDMAWRPLEVAALLARWGRRGLARALVANIKLPMKRKAELVARVREIVETGGWRDLRTRHLYHDRDEFTLTAWKR